MSHNNHGGSPKGSAGQRGGARDLHRKGSLRVKVATRQSEQIMGIRPPPPKPGLTANDIDEHLLTLAQLSRNYGTQLDEQNPTSSKGLPPDVAARRLLENGPNMLSPPKATNPFVVYFSMMSDPLTIMLIIAGILSCFSQAFSPGDWTPTYLGVVLLVIVQLNTCLDFVQAQKSAAVLRGFGNLCPPKATVVRGGVSQICEASELVVGDIVIIKSGDKVPADMRLISCTELKVDNSSLTGESEPLARKTETKAANPLEAENLAFFSSLVTAGQGWGVIVRCGDRTTMGQIAALAGAGVKKVSPLTEEIKMFVKLIAIGAFSTALIFFTAGMFITGNFPQNLLYLIGIFVACTPQGLPATVTTLLTIAAKELSSCNVLVKDLHAVDTLGTITLLASDKTGTLTQNRMSVVDIWMGLKPYWSPANAASRASGGQTETFKQSCTGATELLDCFALCSQAAFEKKDGNMDLPVDKRKVIGDATETGLLKFTSEFMDVDEKRLQHKKVLEMPFDSQKKWALCVTELAHANGHLTLFVKGAPERVVRMCRTALVDGKEVDIAGQKWFSDKFMAAYQDMAGQGERVLANAMLRLDGRLFPKDFKFTREPDNFPVDGFCFLGLVGLQDPPKPGVREAIASCQTAGIQVMMVTGDHPLTAEAIARQVGIIHGSTREQMAKVQGVKEDNVAEADFQAVVVHGDEMSKLTSEDWDMILRKKEVVFARTSPRQKLEIVTRCQAAGHVVGVTGDGVNDSPALRRSDMGISMAITGSDVSREAASIILLDDNFASVVEGIKRGRLIFCNLKKMIQYTLSHIIGEVFPFLLYIMLGLPLGMSSFLILFVDLGTEIAPALSFAWEPEEGDLMGRPPRRHVSPRDIVAFGDEKKDLEKIGQFDVQDVDIANPANKREASALMGQLGYLGNMAGSVKNALCSCEGMSAHHPDDEVLVDKGLLLWSYGQAGPLQVAACLVNYFAIFRYYGIASSDLIGSSREYFSRSAKGDFCSMGNCFSVNRQLEILHEVQSAWYFTVVITQFFMAHCLKVMNKRPCSPDAFVNKTTYYANAFSLLIAFTVVNMPGLQIVLESRPFPGWAIPIAVAGGCVIVAYEYAKRTLTSGGQLAVQLPGRGVKADWYKEENIGGGGYASV